MDTIRVDICYRPLRIGWVIQSGDIGAFRQAVKLSHTLWGGRFNPILMADREDEARRLIDLFRVDLLLPVGVADEVKAFPEKFPHLINPFFHDSIFIGGANERKCAQLLDIHNALAHLRDKPEWKAINDKGFRIYNWQADDPLADVFLTQFGGYPSADEIGIDYREFLAQAFDTTEFGLDPVSPIPADILDHPSPPTFRVTLSTATMVFRPDGTALDSSSAMPPILMIWYAIGTSGRPTSRCGLSIGRISGVTLKSFRLGKRRCASRLRIAMSGIDA